MCHCPIQCPFVVAVEIHELARVPVSRQCCVSESIVQETDIVGLTPAGSGLTACLL
jgi:hypothetical protein